MANFDVSFQTYAEDGVDLAKVLDVAAIFPPDYIF